MLSTVKVKSDWSQSRQVEFLEGYSYCLLPSIGMEQGFAQVYSRMPGFVSDLSYHQFLGKVDKCMSKSYIMKKDKLTGYQSWNYQCRDEYG